MNNQDNLDLLSRIGNDPDVCFGRPYIKQHKVLVSLVLGYLASGSSVAVVMKEFPGIDETDIQACLTYNEHRRAAAASAVRAA